MGLKVVGQGVFVMVGGLGLGSLAQCSLGSARSGSNTRRGVPRVLCCLPPHRDARGCQSDWQPAGWEV